MSDNSPQSNLRSSTKVIKRRPSIHEASLENESIKRDKSPFMQYQKECSRSPVRKEKIYPDIQHLINHSDDNLINNDDEKSEDEISSEKLAHSNINDSTRSQQKSNYCYIIIFLISLLVVAVCVLYSPSSQGNELKAPQSDEKINCSRFYDLKKKYPEQNVKIFKSLKASIEGVFNRDSKLAVFTFYSTDQKVLDEWIHDVVFMTQKCIRQTFDPINLTHSDLNQEKFIDDYSKIIGEYKKELEKRTILVINNLDALSSKIVPSLHSFTDTYNPLVQKSIIYLSIRVPHKPANTANYLFTHLQNKWNDLSSNIRDPLITRLIDQNFYLKSSND